MAHFRSTSFAGGVVVMDSLVFDRSLLATSNCFDCFARASMEAVMRNDTHIKSNIKRKW